MRNRGDVAKWLSNFDWFTNLFPSHAALLILSSHVHRSLRLLPRFSEDTAYPLHSRLRWRCFLLPPLSPPLPLLPRLLIHILCSPVLFIAFASASSQFQPAHSPPPPHPPPHLGSRENRVLLLPAKYCTNTEG